MKKTRILSLVLVFLMMFASVGVFAEEITETPYQLPETAIVLRDNIASAICDTEDVWTVFTMVAYEKYALGSVKMSDDAKKNILNQTINLAKSDEAAAGDRAKIEIVLRSMGIDTKNMYPAGEETPINNGEMLKNADLLSSGHYSAPWILLADMQGNTELSEEQILTLISALDSAKGTGLFESEWAGVTYTDADTASVTLSALARYYGEKDEATQLCDAILEALENAIDENGSFGSANSDAMVIIGLASMGINPYEFRNETTQKSVVDGLLSYANEDNNAFTFYGSENYMATEQGLRALIVLSVFEGEPLNIYDFSDNEVVPGYEITEEPEIPEEPETPEEPEERPSRPVPSGGTSTIKIKITIKSIEETWLSKNIILSKKSTVYNALKKITETTDIEIDDLDEGYIKSITYKGESLSEFDYGKNSGWMYKVNNKVPKVGFDSYKLSDGDAILWYYTEDWEEKEDDKSHSESTSSEKDKDKVTVAFCDIENHWAKDAVLYVAEKGIMNGIGENNFAPDEKFTRGMLVTMLYRLSGDKAKGENSFSDISSDAWYKDAAVWASENNITNGYDNGNFGADDEVTREQLAVFLKRYADLKKIKFNTNDAQNFEDAKELSSWAENAVLWAQISGILSGRDSGAFDPSSGATRAEIAMVFMRFIENVAKK